MEKLRSRLESIKTTIPKDQWKYFHIEGIENFIFHLDNIKKDRTKKRIEDEINSYLLLVEEESTSKKNLTDTYKDLYATKLHSLAIFYEDEFKFIKKPYYPFSFIILTILFIILFRILNIPIAIIVGILIVGSYVIYTRSKIKARKYY